MKNGSFLFFLFFLTNVSFAHDDSLHHWEIPSKDPDRIVITPVGDPSSSIGVTWRTDASVKKAFLQIAKETGAPRFDLQGKTYEADTEQVEFEQSDYNHAFSVNYHSVTIDGLEPDTRYSYRVGGHKNFWSEWIQFRTVSASEDRPIQFLYFGDAQNSVLSHWSRVIRAAYQRAPHASFALHAGDLINRAHHDTEWAEWFKAGGWVHSSIPTVPVAGNHEYGKEHLLTLREKFLAIHWQPQFNLPIEESLDPMLHETVYAVEYPNLKLIVLNSNRLQEEQVEWLRSELAKNTKKWTVVSFHHPIFSSGGGRNNDDLRELWKPLFDEYGVDLILQGHDHTYARGQTTQVPARSVASAEQSEEIQAVYVNSVSGPKMYEFKDSGWDKFKPHNVELINKAENTQFYQVIEVSQESIDYRAYTVAGHLYDAFVLSKDADGVKRIKQGERFLTERSFENTLEYEKNSLPY